MKLLNRHIIIGTLFMALMGGCATSSMTMGSSKADTVATGAAAGATTKDANTQLERCEKPLGTVAIKEDRNALWYSQLTTEYNLPSTVPVLKLLAQQTGCFVVVERGAGMSNMMQERELMKSGELRGYSNFKKGQMVAADYTLIPSITFSAKDTSGIKGVVGAVLGSVAGGIAGSIKTADASTVLILIDNRTGVQVAAASGSARNVDMNILGGVLAGAVGGGIQSYTKTPEGKVIVAAFMDSMNKLVRALREYKAQNVAGGLGAGGALAVQGADGGIVETLEGVIVIRRYVPSKKEYYYKIVTKDRKRSYEFYSPKKIPFKDDLVRFRVIEGEVDPDSIELIERRYLQKHW